MVSRFREERAAGHDVDSAVHRTVQTAGRTVLFQRGHRCPVDACALGVPRRVSTLVCVRRRGGGDHRRRRRGPARPHAAGSLRSSHRVRSGSRDRGILGPSGPAGDAPSMVVVARFGAVLVAVGLPFRAVDAGRIDDRVLPADAPAHAGAEQLRRDFYFVDFNQISVVTPWIDPTDETAVMDFETKLLLLPNVFRVDSVRGFVGVGLMIPATEYNTRFLRSRRWHLVQCDQLGKPRHPLRRGPRRQDSGARSPGASHRDHRNRRGHRRRSRQSHPVGSRHHCSHNIGVVVLHDRQRGRAPQGGAAQPVESHRDLRSAGVGVPGRPPGRASTSRRRVASTCSRPS